MSKSKFLIKVRSKRESRWTHFAYLPEDVLYSFKKATEYRGWTNNDWLGKWAKEDFGYGRIEFWEDLYQLRDDIKAKYRILYPELHMCEPEDSKVDIHGWARVWLVSKMKKEIDARCQAK